MCYYEVRLLQRSGINEILGKMNSWTSEDTKAVKTWFDLDKYREFENISINMLYHEIWARTYFFKPVIEEGMQKTVLKNYMQILDGDPFLIKEKHLNYMDSENKSYQPPYFLLLLLIE